LKEFAQVDLPEGLFVTFYVDSQDCIIWGIVLPREPGREAPVISGPPESLLPKYANSEVEDRKESNPHIVFAAAQFESFLCRW
jgi:hypothetical protein